MRIFGAYGDIWWDDIFVRVSQPVTNTPLGSLTFAGLTPTAGD